MSVKLVKQEENSKAFSYIIDLFVLLILFLFPLFITDGYFNILQTKYYFYIGSVAAAIIALLLTRYAKRIKPVAWIAMAVVLVILGALIYDYAIHPQSSSLTLILYNTSYYLRSFKWGVLISRILILTVYSTAFYLVIRYVKKLTVIDWALLAFLIIAALSTAFSNYVFESFWGNEGRYSGLFLLTLYGAAYFLITRLGRFKNWYLDAFLAASMLICLFGITDYFRMDILSLKVRLIDEQKDMFTSTIGNINTYTAFVGMGMAVAAVLFTTEKRRIKQLCYFICLIISFFAIIMGISDNAYLSIGALFAFLPLYLFGNKIGIKRYIMIIASFFSVIQGIDWINTFMKDRVLGINSAFDIIVSYSGLLWIAAGLWLVVILLYLYDEVKKKSGAAGLKWAKKAWLVILGLGVAGVVSALIDVNVFGNAQRYGSLSSYLLFNDEWGTHRGYIWRNAMECFHQFPFLKKIIGFGPDTFGIVLMDKTQGNIYNEIFDNAHNEYLHYLITIGIGGLIAYLVFIGSFLVRVIRRAAQNRFVMAAFFAVVCYLTQAFVNLNLPIVTPVMWLCLTLGELGVLEYGSNGVSKEKNK